MAVGDVEKGFGSTASSGRLVLSFAVTMLRVVIGASVCCFFGGASVAHGHRMLQDVYVNDPRFSAPILSSFVAGIVGSMAILIPCCIFIPMTGGYARSRSEPAPLTMGTRLTRLYPSISLSAAAGVVGAAILRLGGDMVVLAPGWAAVCGLLGSLSILGLITICCCLWVGLRSILSDI